MIETKVMAYVRCDECGVQDQFAADSLHWFVERGWTFGPGGRDLCPGCSKPKHVHEWVARAIEPPPCGGSQRVYVDCVTCPADDSRAAEMRFYGDTEPASLLRVALKAVEAHERGEG